MTITGRRTAMLFFVFGSLASGKSTVIRELEASRPDLLVVEPDVPRPATTKAARQRQLQERLEQIAATGEQTDVFYAGQSPLGELLACPAATYFAGIAPCLFDCKDETRLERLHSRGWASHIPDSDVVRWAAWMRSHAADPQHELGVLLDGGATELNWDQWIGWRAGDPRWQVMVMDNTDEKPHETLDRTAAWITAQRQSLATGSLPLAAGWEQHPTVEI